jgi:Protein of unknown function (DUF3987)
MSSTFDAACELADRERDERLKRTNGNGKIDPWADPDLSLIDDRRGQLPEFPVDALSPACREWVERAAHGAGVTAAHVATPLIGIASSLIGTSRRVMASKSFTQPATCWTAVVGFSGSGKTPGIDATKRALALVEGNRKAKIADMRRAHETRRETAKAMRDAWSKQLKDIVADSVVDLTKYRSAAKAEPVMPQEAEDPGLFVAPRLHVSNATIERLAQLLEVQPQGALLLSDELASLFLNMSRYSGGQDNEFWLEAWNGGHYTVERMSRPAISIDHLLVGVVGGMQPDKLARSFKGDSDGMSSRFLFSWPPEPSYQPLANDIAEVEPEIVNAITRLVELASFHKKSEGVSGTLSEFVQEVEFAPCTVALSPLAIERFEQFRQFVHAGKQGLDGREREWWSKMPAHVLRLAVTLCFLDWAFVGGPEPAALDDHFMEAAVWLVRDYFWPHARACLRQIGLSDHHKDARRVLRWIRSEAANEISVKDIRRDALAGSLDATQTEKLLNSLAAAGWLRLLKEPSGPHGGRPVLRWMVNPVIQATTDQ